MKSSNRKRKPSKYYYSDDMVLRAKNEKSLKRNLDIIRRNLQRINVNQKKSRENILLSQKETIQIDVASKEVQICKINNNSRRKIKGRDKGAVGRFFNTIKNIDLAEKETQLDIKIKSTQIQRDEYLQRHNERKLAAQK